jgi:hypothetical protein
MPVESKRKRKWSIMQQMARKGGLHRARNLSPQQRQDAARAASAVRWAGHVKAAGKAGAKNKSQKSLA